MAGTKLLLENTYLHRSGRMLLAGLVICFLSGINYSCETQSESQIVSSEHYQFSLLKKSEDFFYADETGYPENATFILKINHLKANDLVKAVLNEGKFSTKEQIIHYLSFELQKKIRISDDSEIVIKPIFFHFERSFDLKKERVFIISFDLSEIDRKSDLFLTIDSKILGEDPIKFNLNDFEIYKS